MCMHTSKSTSALWTSKSISAEPRARKQPEGRQARLNRQRERDHERRAMEEPEARQSRLERIRRFEYAAIRIRNKTKFYTGLPQRLPQTNVSSDLDPPILQRMATRI